MQTFDYYRATEGMCIIMDDRSIKRDLLLSICMTILLSVLLFYNKPIEFGWAIDLLCVFGICIGISRFLLCYSKLRDLRRVKGLSRDLYLKHEETIVAKYKLIDAFILIIFWGGMATISIVSFIFFKSVNDDLRMSNMLICVVGSSLLFIKSIISYIKLKKRMLRYQ